jgi:DNA-binding response OmpR family regulator
LPHAAFRGLSKPFDPFGQDGGGSMTRVLIVDDVRLLAEIRATPLGRASVETSLLRAGDDAVAAARASRPDLVVLEEGECYPEAFEACRRLGDDPDTATIPVLYIGLPLHRERCAARGVAEFLARPATHRDLDQAVRRLLRDSARRGTRRVVAVPCAFEQDGARIPARCLELSLDGAFVRLEGEPAAGPGRLLLPNGTRPIEVPAEVVRAGPGRGGPGWGLRFLPFGIETTAQLARFVRSAAERRGQAVDAATPDAP